MRKFYRLIDSAPRVEDNVSILLGMGAVHYSTITGHNGIYRNFVILLDEDDLLIAKLSLQSVAIDILSDDQYEHLKCAGYIK